MPALKTVISDADARRLLDDRWGPVTQFTRLSGGESTQAFGIDTGTDRLVLRVNRRFTYEKDAMLARRYASASIPVPAVLATGTSNGFHWAVSRLAWGRLLSTLAPGAVRRLVPDLIQVLGAVHCADIAGTSGYGNFDHEGRAQFGSWRVAVLNHDALVNWDHFSAIAPERVGRLVRSARDQVDRLIVVCPEYRVLTHGDILLDNLLGEDDRITAVIDWSDARFGDPLWDVARCDFWQPGLDIVGAYLAVWGNRRELSRRARERILCYQLLIAANAVGFFVHTDQLGKLGELPDRTDTLLREARRVPT